MLSGPEILKLPPKCMPIVEEFNDFKYFMLHGGRGSGKTQSVARLLLYLGEARKVRIVCGREHQNTIEESVYTVFRDLISQYHLDYDVFANKIVHRKTGSEIRFKGFRDQGNAGIKGFEGADVLWVDEAQTITKATLDIIIPTLRKDNIKIYFTLNRHQTKDPVYVGFSNREDCLTIKVNYVDNQYISQTLLDEAMICKRDAPEDFEHIWLGYPKGDIDNYLFSESDLDACVGREFEYDPDLYGTRIMGCDVARFGDNYTAGMVLRQCGPTQWEEEILDRWKKQDAVYSTGKFTEMIQTHKPALTIVDADGLGGPVYDFLAANRSMVMPFHGGQVKGLNTDVYKNWRTYGYLTLAKMISAGNLRIKSPKVIDQLREIQYRYDTRSRKYIIPKEQLIEAARSRGIPFNSPDEADALMMAATQINGIDKKIRDNTRRSQGRSRGGKSYVYAEERPLF